MPLLTIEELKSIEQLIQGTREPGNGMERHFLQVINGLAKPCSPKEREWFEYWCSLDKDASDFNRDDFKHKYESALEIISERERTINYLQQHIASLKSEIQQLALVQEQQNHSNESLLKEVTQLKAFLHKAHLALEKYEPVGSTHSEKGDTPTWERCHQCGGDGGVGGRCPRCNGNGFEP